MTAGPAAILAMLTQRALDLPEAYEDHPWDETVVKVRKKIFVFLGGGHDDSPPGFGVKLAMSHDHALSLPQATPMSHGLGKSGWVTVTLAGDLPTPDVLADWVEESYRLVAPKRLVAMLDAG